MPSDSSIPTRRAHTVRSSSGRLDGRLYEPFAGETLPMLVFRDPADFRHRIKRRVNNAEEARRVLDEAELDWNRRIGRNPTSARVSFLTQEEQKDALCALGMLQGRVSLTDAVTGFLHAREFQESFFKPDGGREIKAKLRALRLQGVFFKTDAPADVEAPPRLDENSTIWDAFQVFLHDKEREGKSKVTQITYLARFKRLLADDIKDQPVRSLTKELVAGACLCLSESSAYGLLTVASSFEKFLRRQHGFSEACFSLSPIREASVFFHKDGVFFLRDPGRRERDKEMAEQQGIPYDRDYYLKSEAVLAELSGWVNGAFVEEAIRDARRSHSQRRPQ